MPESDREIPTLPIKLSGATTYPQWIISIEKYLDLIPIGTTEYRVWDIVLGDYQRPTVPKEKASDEAASKAKRELRAWRDADNIGLLTIQKNCEDDILAKIGNETSAKGAYDKLKKAYEGKTVPGLYTLLDSLLLKFDDENDTIEIHITKYERVWHTFARVILRADLQKDTGFGKGLKEFANCNQAKAEFLLRSLPTFYSDTVENIRTKEYRYDDVVRKLKEYIPKRQNGWKNGGVTETATVMKLGSGQKSSGKNRKTCGYCQSKGRKGQGAECWTKQRDEANVVTTAAVNKANNNGP